MNAKNKDNQKTSIQVTIKTRNKLAIIKMDKGFDSVEEVLLDFLENHAELEKNREYETDNQVEMTYLNTMSELDRERKKAR